MATNKVTKLIAVVGRKKYECVPSANCTGCAFEKRCYRLDRGSHRTGRFECPVFNDYSIASDMDFIYKEAKDEKNPKGRHSRRTDGDGSARVRKGVQGWRRLPHLFPGG